MAPLHYRRDLWTRSMSASVDGRGARVDFEAPQPVTATLTARTLERWRAEPDSYLPAPFRRSELRRRLLEWARAEPSGEVGDYWLKRLVLRVSEPRLVALPWEKVLAVVVTGIKVVRVSPVRPDVLGIPLTFPLRFLQLEPQTSRISVDGVVDQLVGARRRAGLVKVTERPVAGLLAWRGRSRWPTAEVVHMPMLLKEPIESLLSSASSEPGSLGWMERFLGTWQTRLVVLECRTAGELAAGRVLATATAERGGPATFVVDARAPDSASALESLYADLFHDHPLEIPLIDSWALVGGAGREEALRVSRIGIELLALQRQLAPPRRAAKARAKTRVKPPAKARSLEGRSPRPRPLIDLVSRTRPDLTEDAALRTIRSAIDESVAGPWKHLQFQFHEGEGTVPLAGGVRTVRRAAGVRAPRHVAREEAPGPRYLNARLAHSDEGDELHLVPQAGPPLVAGRRYHLMVHIGPRDRAVYTAREEALLEEKFLWKPGDRGRWVEIAVSGLGFDVAGAPVRQIWLPREAPSLSVTFPLVAPRAGVASVRVCLYVNQNLVQALRVAARVVGPRGGRDPGERALAEDLDLPSGEVGRRVWLPRVEYDLGGGFADQRDRAVSLVVNEHNGQDKITVKGEDLWIDLTADLPHLVQEVRDLLSEISTPGFETKPEKDWLYGFGLWGDRLNRGLEEELAEQLQQLAAIGWRLYDLVVSSDQRPRLNRLLKADDQKIHVAHLLLEKVVPWAVIYDRKFASRGRRTKDGKPVARATCLAALPDADGVMPGFDCGDDPSCLLHPANARQRERQGLPPVIEETVACPRRFWGFRHQIELPPQQADRRQRAPEQSAKVRNDRPTRIAFGGHGGLTQAQEHLEQLKRKVEQQMVNGKVVSLEWDRDRVVDSLADLDLDVVYLYCHAEGKRGTEAWPPVLRFGHDDASEGVVEAGDLDAAAWTHSPVVVINGCRSAAFAPDTLSSFIRKLTRDRKAGGLLGTEITVWEQLAGEVGEAFLLPLLSGASSCGMALLTARRRLLHKLNPLGLVYTLYANVDLELARKPST